VPLGRQSSQMAFSARSLPRGTGSLPSREASVPKLQAPSVCGGAGGSGTHVSPGSSYGRGCPGSCQALLPRDSQLTLQGLNRRLASYLQRVRALEQDNARIQQHISHWCRENSPAARHDYSSYFTAIEELQDKVSAAQLENARRVLQMDNAKLAAEDFRLKYENELLLRQNAERDINELLQVLDGLTLTKADLELQIESVKEELMILKKNHEEEVDVLCKHVGGPVKVEVDAAPSIDLATAMEKMRLQYEEMAEKYRQEAKDQFEKQTQQLDQEVEINMEQLEDQRKEVTEQRQIFQSLELELQSHLNMNASLEGTLADTEARYSDQLARVQEAAASLEAQLRQVRADLAGQSQEYSVLLDAKTRLEMEIATYRRLLDGEDSGAFSEFSPPISAPESSKVKKIKTIVEEMVDGKVVSSQVKEIEEKL
ncbi:K1C20 protein, partial [Alcedo cyanopectus]|nr:K1C20 protein [Ceyx cyanopectus]